MVSNPKPEPDAGKLACPVPTNSGCGYPLILERAGPRFDPLKPRYISGAANLGILGECKSQRDAPSPCSEEPGLATFAASGSSPLCQPSCHHVSKGESGHLGDSLIIRPAHSLVVAYGQARLTPSNH
nr:hypothetical protein [Candidatus Sigynarchaeota archaeon]